MGLGRASGGGGWFYVDPKEICEKYSEFLHPKEICEKYSEFLHLQIYFDIFSYTF